MAHPQLDQISFQTKTTNNFQTEFSFFCFELKFNSAKEKKEPQMG